MNRIADTRCATALGRALAGGLSPGEPSPPRSDADREFLRPVSGPHNAVETYGIAISVLALGWLVSVDVLARATDLALPLRIVLGVPLAVVLLQVLGLCGIVLRCPGPFILGALTVYGAVFLLDAPWTRWFVVAWIAAIGLNATIRTLEFIADENRDPTRVSRAAVIALNLLAPAAAIALLFLGHPVLALAALFTAHAVLLVATLVPNCTWLGPIVRERPGDGNALWLTIDDGPDPGDTPRILDLLDANGATATFFLVGDKARAHPELVREIVARGHRIGNHTQTHPAHTFWRLGPKRIAREIGDCQQTLAQITGEPPSLFRAPVGMRNPFVHPVLRKHRLTLVGWSARGFDGTRTDTAKILARLRRNLRPGAIVLVHEATPIAESLLKELLVEVKKRGFAFVAPDFHPDPTRRK